MDLYSGIPYWIVKNELNLYTRPLPHHLDIKVAIIGSGITGALVAHELCSAGIECAIIDKRAVGTGSTAASTAQLQYEIDTPMHVLAGKYGEAKAAEAYKASLRSITDIEMVVKKTGIKADFRRRSSILLASNHSGYRQLQKEYELRSRNDIPVSFLDQKALKAKYNIDRLAALYNNEAAEIDAYKMANELIAYHAAKGKLQLFPYNEISEEQAVHNGYLLKTTTGKTIHCNYLVVAAGFEAGQFLPDNVMNLISTYALISEPVEASDLWTEKSLIWETKTPYCYLRTTPDNRIIIGGEDLPFKNEKVRDLLLKQKTERLEKQFKALFPGKPFKVDMAWCGTFSSTKDGLPFIGPYHAGERKLFALGYGGNGITFSMIAAQVITSLVQGKQDKRLDLFGFDRLHASSKKK